MKPVSKCTWALAASMLLAANCRAEILTFEGLQKFEGVDNYYNGGNGSLGSGPGPAYGITFDSNSLAYIPANPYPGDPSPPTVLLLANLVAPGGVQLSTIMDVTGGFASSLTFYYININDGTGSVVTDVEIYSGLDGTGNLLANEDLSTTPEAFGGPLTLDFSGTAYSVVFSGGNQQLALDNITLQTLVPEPGTMILFASSLPFVLIVRRKVAPF
jgi:hypothetical protein